jgi:NAD(P)-dependent dehydrogenase (short-subunit alcohol dehydrogenase family)
VPHGQTRRKDGNCDRCLGGHRQGYCDHAGIGGRASCRELTLRQERRRTRRTRDQARRWDAVIVGGDISKAADVRRLFTKAEAAFGSVDVLVNNAGVPLRSLYGCHGTDVSCALQHQRARLDSDDAGDGEATLSSTRRARTSMNRPTHTHVISANARPDAPARFLAALTCDHDEQLSKTNRLYRPLSASASLEAARA